MAPSVLRTDEQRVPQIVGMTGLIAVTLGSVALLISIAGGTSRVNPTFGAILLLTGLGCLLFHAVNDQDLQIRRSYGVLGYLLLALGIVISLLPIKGGMGAQFLPYGFVSFTLASFFLMAFARNETDPVWRRTVVNALGLVGLILTATGFIGGNAAVSFLLPGGLLLSLLGLGYLWAFVVLRGPADDLGYRVGQGLGILGCLVILVALGRSTLPSLFFSWGWLTTRPDAYLIPSGLLLMTIGALYVFLSLGICSDRPIAVLTRRELAAFFCSPLAYIVLFVLTLVAALNYWIFINTLVPSEAGMMQGAVRPEPIVTDYIISWLAIFLVLFVVPALTMRLLSEEHRTGTLEVLFTAPVTETAVVFSKFFATFVFFVLAWLPWGLFLISLRVEGGQPFEYRPLFSFFIALVCTGAGFLAMGLFFSSLTRHQIAAFLFTFIGMLFWFALFWIKRIVVSSADSKWNDVLNHMSYVELWIESMNGVLVPDLLLFHISAAIFWLFLTIKVLEARKWL